MMSIMQKKSYDAVLKTLVILITYHFSFITLLAKPGFIASKQYHIVCQQFTRGCVTDGKTAGQSTPLYYLTTARTTDETWWVLTEESNGCYSIKNAKTNQYVTYDGVRSDISSSGQLRRYVSMTAQKNGNNSLWTIITQGDGVYIIRNVAKQDHIWDVRTDSYCVGTYSNSGNGNQNQCFMFYDTQGNQVKEQREEDSLKRLAGNITIDGRGLAYAASTDIYLCSIPLRLFNTDYEAVIGYDTAKQGATITIDGSQVQPEGTFCFTNITGGKNYTLTVTAADGTKATKNLTFTSLPIVTIYGSFSNNYSNGSIMVYEPDKTAPQQLSMKAKWRGGITNSSDKHKRNYHVKLLDENGEKLEQKFFGLRNDNSWILEACQVDMSRIRNRVLTDLWNDYCQLPYYSNKEPKALSGTRGNFVELILNDEYRGIYCMTENIDRKQMKLVKYDEETGQIHGQLWKSKDWSYATFMGTKPDGNYSPKDYLSTPNPNKDMWDSYQVKYPDIEDSGNQTDWQTLYEAVKFVCTSDDGFFTHYAEEYFDLPVLIDYYILMETILSTDNHGKNMFYACYDQVKSKKITFAVWDMDATCGQRWSDSYYHSTLMSPEQDYAEYISRNEHGDYNLFKRMRNTNASNFNQKVRLRYRDLRQSHLSTESILERFQTYLNEFKTAGADKREYARWNGDTDIARLSLNFDTEMKYIADWFTRRMDYLDTYRFDIASLPPSGIEYNTTTNPSQKVYDLQGRYVGERDNLQELPRGIYIVNGKKLIKK